MKILEVLTEKRKIGNVGENAAARLLKKSGYKILKRNFVALGYEIDIIAYNGEYIVFCEVKTRTEGHDNPNEPRPASAVNREKQRKIISASKLYNSDIKFSRKTRFDIIEVLLDAKKAVKDICHLEGAFTADTAYKK